MHTTRVEGGADDRSREPRATNASCTGVPELASPALVRADRATPRSAAVGPRVSRQVPDRAGAPVQLLPPAAPPQRGPCEYASLLVIGSVFEPEMQGSGSSPSSFGVTEPGSPERCTSSVPRPSDPNARMPLARICQGESESVSDSTIPAAQVGSRGPMTNWRQNWRRRTARPEVTTIQLTEPRQDSMARREGLEPPTLRFEVSRKGQKKR